MKDKKFLVAVAIIVVLVLVLLYVLLIGPQVQGYIVDKKVEGYNVAVEQLIQQINSQGYVIMPSGDSYIVLSRNPSLEQQLQQSMQGANQQALQTENTEQ